MFTSNNILDPIQYPGKTYPKINYRLALTIIPGVVVNYHTWVPLYDTPYNDIVIEASYDNVILIPARSVAKEPIVVDVELEDSHIDTEHLLKIKLSGKNDSHTFICNDQNENASFAIQVKLRIEDLPINLCLDDQELYNIENGNTIQWTSLMGQNGEQVIPLRTPIYPWLLSHSQQIITELVNLRTEI